MEFTIRKEQKSDSQTVHDLIELAFRREEFSDHKEHFLVDKLRRSDAFVPELSLVAESDGKIIGHILLTKVEIVSEEGAVAALGLAPVAVLPEYQGMGIGGELIREAHKRAAELGYKASVLLGHKDYYPKFGYRKAIDFGIEFPFEAPLECCMAAELVPGGLKGVHGVVKYSQPFME